MNIQEFVDSLSMDAYEHLRVAVVSRQSKQAEEFAMGLGYLISQPALMKAAATNAIACINVLTEKTQLPRALMAKVVAKYLEDPEQYVDTPLNVIEINSGE